MFAKNMKRLKCQSLRLCYSTEKVYTFSPSFEIVANMPPTSTVDQILSEHPMYSADLNFVRNFGGPLTLRFVESIPKTYYQRAKELGLFPNFDIRVHQFDPSILNTPGLRLYPAVPGLHCDGEWRETYHAQPKLYKVPVSDHITATVASQIGITNPRYLLNSLSMNVGQLDDVEQGYTLWEKVDKLVNSLENVNYYQVPDGSLLLFGSRSLHEAMPVNFPGCRIFFRCSMWHRQHLGNGGKHSITEQIYTTFNRVNSYPQQLSPESCVIGTFPTYQVIGTTLPSFSIEQFADEPCFFNVSCSFAKDNGGPILTALIEKIPVQFFERASSQQLVVRVDFLVYRLYPGYYPNIPGYDGQIRLPGWHLPINTNHNKARPEILISLSTIPDQIGNTEIATLQDRIEFSAVDKSFYHWAAFNDIFTNKITDSNVKKIKDGDIVILSSDTPRREAPVLKRGWRAVFRVSMRDPSEKEHGHIKHLYVSVPHKSKGW